MPTLHTTPSGAAPIRMRLRAIVSPRLKRNHDGLIREMTVIGETSAAGATYLAAVPIGPSAFEQRAAQFLAANIRPHDGVTITCHDTRATDDGLMVMVGVLDVIPHRIEPSAPTLHDRIEDMTAVSKQELDALRNLMRSPWIRPIPSTQHKAA